MMTPFKATPNPTLNDWKRIGTLMRYKNRKVVSFEPLLGPLPEDVSLAGVDWVVIGSLSIERLDEFGNTIDRNRHVQPTKEWVTDIVQRSKKLGIPVFMKKTLTGFGTLIQQYP